MARPNMTVELIDRILASDKRRKKAVKYQTLQAWMEGKRINGERLLAMLREERGVSISPGHLSNLLKGSRRMPLTLAVEIHELTGVPLRSLLEWPVKETHSSRSVA